MSGPTAESLSRSSPLPWKWRHSSASRRGPEPTHEGAGGFRRRAGYPARGRLKSWTGRPLRVARARASEGRRRSDSPAEGTAAPPPGVQGDGSWIVLSVGTTRRAQRSYEITNDLRGIGIDCLGNSQELDHV